MVNDKSNTPGSSGAGSTPSAASAGAGSTPGGSTAGGGSFGVTPLMLVAKAPKTFRKEVTALVAGFGTQFPDGISITVNGQVTDKASILAALQAALALYAAVDQSVHAMKQNRVALQAAIPAVHQYAVGIKAALVAFFGKGNPALAAFGLGASKPHPLTSEQNVARKQKAGQTRKLRGTLGKRQKQGVKFQGQVEIQAKVSGVPAAGASPSPAGGDTGAATPSGGDAGGTAPATK